MRFTGWPGTRVEDHLLPALRSATHVEKSTLKGTDGKLNAVSASSTVSHAPIMIPTAAAPDLDGIKACRIDDPECEACQ